MIEVPGALWLLLLIPVFLGLTALMLFLMVRILGLRPFQVVEVDEEGRPVDGSGAPAHLVGAPRPRPWWGSPLLWAGVAVTFLLLGLFVLPHFLGGAFVFVPFVWLGRPRAGRG